MHPLPLFLLLLVSSCKGSSFNKEAQTPFSRAELQRSISHSLKDVFMWKQLGFNKGILLKWHSLGRSAQRKKNDDCGIFFSTWGYLALTCAGWTTARHRCKIEPYACREARCLKCHMFALNLTFTAAHQLLWRRFGPLCVCTDNHCTNMGPVCTNGAHMW